jgi:hypothetical protein
MMALTRMQIQMAKNYITVEDRLECSLRLEEGMRHMEKNIQGVVHSVQSINQQLLLLE